MTLSTNLAILAATMKQVPTPAECAAIAGTLRCLSIQASRLERTLDEISADAAEDARLAAARGTIAYLRPAFTLIQGDRA